MRRKTTVLAIAIAIVAVIAFAITSVAFADGPQNAGDSCYPWEGNAGWGGSCDGECDGGDQNKYGPGQEDSGWGEPQNGMGPERQLRKGQ